jgi:pimeloyl-ACP methyl ester carboxylesterase
VAEIYKSEEGRRTIQGFYRSALERWPVANRRVMVPTCEGETFVVVSGEADHPPVVLFHGSGSNSIAWTRDVAAWSQRYCVYSVDLIGEPGLSAPARPPLASDRYARWLDDVWNHLGLTSASVVGLSLGGWLALDYAVRRPQRVRSLSLISPAGIGSQNRMALLRLLPLLMLGRWGRLAAQRAVARHAGMPREVAEYMSRVFEHFRPRLERIPRLTDNELAALSMPVHVMAGGRDPLLRSDETRDRATAHIRDLRLTFLEDQGHLLPRQTENILAFLDEVTSNDTFQRTA